MRQVRPAGKPAGLTGLLLLLVIAGSACGGSDSSGGTPATAAEAAAGEPRRGGSVVYALEAETPDGFCIGETVLAASGLTVVRSMFETLTVPNADGEYVPFLAEAVTPNATYDEWTIEVRSGVTFHDGSELTAEVVKNNLDSFRGAYPNRHPMLPVFSFANVDTVTVTDPMTVTVTTKTPWPSFPAFLYYNGRFGMMAQAQLDDPETCATKPIGSGPFRLAEWEANDHLTVARNETYWREGLPYLDEIVFRPMPDGLQRVNALEAGEVQVTHVSMADTVFSLRQLAEDGRVALVEGPADSEVMFLQLNVSKAPFDNLLARWAVAYAIDRDAYNEIRNRGILENASGPFPPGNMGHLEDAGYPEFDLEQAQELARQYEAETGSPIEFTITTAPDPSAIDSTQLLVEMLGKAGIKASVKQSEQAALLRDMLGGNYDAVTSRSYPGGDPDLDYIWWRSGGTVNLGRIADPEVDRLLDAGRTSADPEERQGIYEELNRRLADQVYNAWLQWTPWSAATAPGVQGIFGPELPDGSEPLAGLANGHSMAGLWIDS